jgi:hypothetical protein
MHKGTDIATETDTDTNIDKDTLMDNFNGQLSKI